VLVLRDQFSFLAGEASIQDETFHVFSDRDSQEVTLQYMKTISSELLASCNFLLYLCQAILNDLSSWYGTFRGSTN